jgi:hypothetical protein
MNTSNGEQVEQVEHRKNLNPFATEEDSDEEDDAKDEFTVGDLEAEEEGKGHLSPNPGLQGKEESIEGLLSGDKNVCIPDLAFSSWNSSTAGSGGGGSSRASFPSMWPFGKSSPGQKNSFVIQDRDRDGLDDRSHFRGANDADYVDKQSSDDSDNSSDDGYGDSGVGGTEFGIDGKGYRGKRRLSVTTEAKRRTSLEDDDDDDEVVHVALAEAHAEGKGDVREGEGDDGELVEIQHAEMQGVEGGGVSEK